jgi:hypothetical protein
VMFGPDLQRHLVVGPRRPRPSACCTGRCRRDAGLPDTPARTAGTACTPARSRSRPPRRSARRARRGCSCAIVTCLALFFFGLVGRLAQQGRVVCRRDAGIMILRPLDLRGRERVERSLVPEHQPVSYGPRNAQRCDFAEKP